MQDRVLDAPHILVDRHPISYGGWINRPLAIVRAAEAGEVPGGVDKGVERIRFASRGLAAAWAGHILPAGMMFKRIARPVEGDVVWQHDRQIPFRHRNDPAAFAVNHRDRAAPVALARDQPVAQAVMDGSFAGAEFYQSLNRRAFGRRHVEAIEEAGVDDAAILEIGRVAYG